VINALPGLAGLERQLVAMSGHLDEVESELVSLNQVQMAAVVSELREIKELLASLVALQTGLS
jgi:acyl-coenzyme A synthetase/AMP-(fatty) acid ligase